MTCRPGGNDAPRAAVRRAVRELHGVPMKSSGPWSARSARTPGSCSTLAQLKRAGRDTDRIVNRHVVRASAIVGDVLRR